MERQTATFLGILVIGLFALESVSFLAVQGPGKDTVASVASVASFDSYSQLEGLVLQRMTYYQTHTYLTGMTTTFSMTTTLTATATSESTATGPASAATQTPFTSTNVQVQGVDELDSVKTDGRYLYVASKQNVFVVLAYPANESKVIARLPFNGTVEGLFLSQSRLAVVWTTQTGSTWDGFNPSTAISIFDLTTPSNPEQVKEISVDASYVSSRLTDGFIYAVLQRSAVESSASGTTTVVRASIRDSGVNKVIPASSIYYNPSSNSTLGLYTIVLSIRLVDGLSTTEAVLTGSDPTIYASLSNIYVAYPDSSAVRRLLPLGQVSTAMMPTNLGWEGPNTTIFRIAIANNSVQVAAEGTVPGTVLNQFSMDEYGGFFRIATTSSLQTSQGAQPANNLYVLDSKLSIVGSLEGFAQDEKIYSVRFMGDRAYVVTFYRVDPLFAISLDDPTHPAILSQLTMPGFSDYLHPIGDGLLVGVGKNSTLVPEGPGMFTLYQGLKVSLFRIESGGNTTEVSRLFIGDRGSDSPVLSDHKAFLYDPATKIMGLPILVAKIDRSTSGLTSWDYGTPVWQGAVLYNVSSSGFSLIGNITQVPHGQAIDANQDLFVSRILLIGNFVYTISDRMILVSAVPSLQTVSEIPLA